MLILDGLQLNAAVLEDLNHQLSEEVSLQLYQTFLVKVFSAATEQEVLLFPLIQIDFNTRREYVSEHLPALVNLKDKWFLERVLLALLLRDTK